MKIEATFEDLYRVRDKRKAEIVDGKLVLIIRSGGKEGRAIGKIIFSLSEHEEKYRGGFTFGDNVGFGVNHPRGKSFSRDGRCCLTRPSART